MLKVLIQDLSNKGEITEITRENCAFLIQYLITNVKQIFAERSIDDLKQVCKLLSDYQQSQKLKLIDSLPLFEAQTEIQSESMLDKISARFMRVIAEHLFI